MIDLGPSLMPQRFCYSETMRSTLKRILGERNVARVRRALGKPQLVQGNPFVFPEFVLEIVSKVESDPGITSRTDAIIALRNLGLDDFGTVLLSMPHPKFAKLSRLLPAMASDDVQIRWTGTCGIPLLKQTLDFVRSAAYNYSSVTGRSLSDATILDFGCGYGRIARLMYYFVNETNFYGVDPWDTSIELCRTAGLSTNFHISDYLPSDLPVGETRFDLMYAFSVFTHLSERATLAALRTLRRYSAESSILAVTIRPIEYWRQDKAVSAPERNDLELKHRQTGFAFRPHTRPPLDGDITYGETSITLDWLSTHCPEWTIQGIDRSLDDPFQIYVFLSPA